MASTLMWLLLKSKLVCWPLIIALKMAHSYIYYAHALHIVLHKYANGYIYYIRQSSFERKLQVYGIHVNINIIIVCDFPLGVVSNYIASDRHPRTAAAIDNIITTFIGDIVRSNSVFFLIMMYPHNTSRSSLSY